MVIFGKTKDIMLQSAQPINGLRYMPTLPDKPVFTIPEAAEFSGYNAEYIRKLIRADKLKGHKFGSILVVEIDSLKEYLSQADDIDDRRYGPKR